MSLNKDYIEFVKRFGCSVCGVSPVDAHHLDTIGMGGNKRLRGGLFLRSPLPTTPPRVASDWQYRI